MSAREGRRIEVNGRGIDDRTPLLPHNHDERFRRRRGDLPMWRHVLYHKMTWAWYNTVVATGSISLILYDLPYRVHRLWVLGSIVYIASLILFVFTFAVHLLRFMIKPSLIPRSMKHPDEGNHVSSLAAAMGVLILNGVTYSEKIHGYNPNAMRTFFWIFIVLSTVFGIMQPLIQFGKPIQEHRVRRDFTPAGMTPVIPLLLAGPVAAGVLAHLEPKLHHTALGIFAFGVALQGMGIFLSLLYSANILERLHREGFPPSHERPGLFLASIPPALTSWAFSSLAAQAVRHFPPNGGAPGGNPDFVVGGVALSYVGVAASLLFWGLAVWWFFVAALANLGQILNLGSDVLEGFMVVFAHAAMFLANNQLLRIFEWPKALTVTNEVLGVATVVVWGILVVGCMIGLVTGRLLEDD
ncbi:Similar to Putative malic acid transport protein; acc. no. O59815 [Pyronema omphalodes CBS 100304]|uniref:Similar to Putative malic acid transport protein acc. no. O59815 n=1 Tax=Pyronema omphalodes (strain CBS 100304) TaxID=1076935 RepID=U4L8I3_PYROM|nr:Similar to Putative malic acid transport protein; acc. no. O59815 [Pyronema omphalodes CBS 100304]